MEVFVQLLDEIDDVLTAIAHGALALETRLAGVAGWVAGLAAFLGALAGLSLGIGA